MKLSRLASWSCKAGKKCAYGLCTAWGISGKV
jgi:hypothetical protein